MSDARPRAFLPALALTFAAALACSQAAFAQEVVAPRAGEEKAAAPAEAAKPAPAETVKDETPDRTPRSLRDDARLAAAFAADGRTASERGAAEAKAVKFDGKSFVVPAPELFAAQGTTTARQDDDNNSGYTPLTAEQKMKRAFKSAFLSPAGYAWTAFNAALTEMGEEDLPHKDTEDRIADWGSRFAIQFGRRATRSLLGSGVYPALFKQEPRYIKSTKKGFAPRTLYAVSRVFVTRGDNGNSQFNISRVAGNISASALSNLWEQSTPGHDRIGTGPTFRRVTTMFISDALFNIFREFW